MELETSLKKLSRRELQSLAKRCGVRANSKSTQIVAEMLTFCKNTLKATPLFGDLLFPKRPPTTTEDEPRASLVVYENNAFQDKPVEKPEPHDDDTDVKSNGVSDEVAKAYRDGKERGIWFGRMYQKLDDLEDQWKSYLAQPKRRRGLRQKENRTGSLSKKSRQAKTPGPKGRHSPRRIRKREVKRVRTRTPLSVRKKTIGKGRSQIKRRPL